MKLTHRLSLLIGLLLPAVLVVTLVTGVYNARSYLNRQLASHAQDTATALGLALSTALADADGATLASTVDALFDRGDYTRIAVENTTGTELYLRTRPVSVDGVPTWFVRLLPLETPEMAAKVMHGWQASGRVTVRSHPGYAYLQLWENSRVDIAWVGAAGLVALAIGLLVLRGLMRPLAQIEAQADAICRREFPRVTPLPRSPELARIVVAMNRMSRKLEEIINGLEELARRFQNQAFRHPVTGLANKRYFIDTLHDLAASPDRSGRGALLLIQLRDFKRYNELHGYRAGDKLLEEAAGRLRTAVRGRPGCLLAHLSGGDFAILAEAMGDREAQGLIEAIGRTLSDLPYLAPTAPPAPPQIGALVFDAPHAANELLSGADQALRNARTKGPGASHVDRWNAAPAAATGADAHRRTIRRAVEAGQLSYQQQPVVSCPERRLLHYEQLARLQIGTEEPPLLAGRFVPDAAAMGLCPLIDREMIRLAIARLGFPEHASHRMAVNIAPMTLDDPEFSPWLATHLERAPEAARRLSLEMPELGLADRMEAVRELTGTLRRHGAGFGLDRCGHTNQSIIDLRALRPDYIKIDGTFTRSLARREEHRFFIHTLANIAHGLDIQVLVEAVEDDATWALLPELKVDGAQGYFLGQPR